MSVPGPMCRSVRDAARYIDTIAGPTDHRPDIAAEARPPRTKRRCLSGDAVAAAARQAGGVVVDARLRGVRPRGREARARSRATRSSATPASSSSTSTCAFPQARPVVGHHLSRSRCRAITARRARRAADDITPVSRNSVRDDRGLDMPTRSAARAAPPRRVARRDRGRVRRSRPAADADDRDHCVRGRGSAAVGDRGPARRRHGLGAVHRAVQHVRASPRSASRPDSRPKVCRSACRWSRAATKRSSCSRAAWSRRPTARGPSSPRWRTRRRPIPRVVTGTYHRGRIDRGRDRRQEQEQASEEVTEVAPGVLRMQLPIWMPGLGHVNMYGLVDDQGHRGRRSRAARSAVVEGAEGPLEVRGLPHQGHPHGGRHALASRPLRRRGPHRARSERASSSRTTRSRRGR